MEFVPICDISWFFFPISFPPSVALSLVYKTFVSIFFCFFSFSSFFPPLFSSLVPFPIWKFSSYFTIFITHFGPSLHFQFLFPEKPCDTWTCVSSLFYLRVWLLGVSIRLEMYLVYPLWQYTTPLYKKKVHLLYLFISWWAFGLIPTFSY